MENSKLAERMDSGGFGKKITKEEFEKLKEKKKIENERSQNPNKK